MSEKTKKEILEDFEKKIVRLDNLTEQLYTKAEDGSFSSSDLQVMIDFENSILKMKLEAFILKKEIQNEENDLF